MTTSIERFAEYAIAFEEVFRDDAWHRLEPFFTADAEHVVEGGGPLALHSKGRAAVIADLRQSVDALDRRFDRRLPEIVAGPEERDGAVWMAWRLTFQRDGLPDLRIEGDHRAFYRGDAITRIEETIAPEVAPALEAYVTAHGERLHPHGGPRAERAADAGGNDGALSPARMRALVDGYARAKSRADVDGALAFCHDDFVLETVSFGVSSHGKAETALHLHALLSRLPRLRRHARGADVRRRVGRLLGYRAHDDARRRARRPRHRPHASSCRCFAPSASRTACSRASASSSIS